MLLHHPGVSGLLLIFVVAVASVDLYTRRIPNALTLSGAVIGVGLCVWNSGAVGLLEGGAGLLVGLIAFFPFYVAGGFGAGDVKAMGAVGAFLGPKGALLAAAWTLVAGGLGGIGVLIGHGGLGSLPQRVHRWTLQAWSLYAIGRVPSVGAPAGGVARRRFPYGLAIACGTLASIIWS